MSWNDRRASSRSSATIWRSMSSIARRAPYSPQRIAVVRGPLAGDPCVMSTHPVVDPQRAAGQDFMPLHGIDHVELWVGNAAQAAYFYREAFGFRQIAYAGLETGVRDRVSFVLEQGRIRLVLTGALTPGHEIGRAHV